MSYKERPEEARLYEVAVIQYPSIKEYEDGKEPTLLLPPTPVLAGDRESASSIACSGKNIKMNARTKVLVRDFL